jgi:hypothetical protein
VTASNGENSRGKLGERATTDSPVLFYLLRKEKRILPLAQVIKIRGELQIERFVELLRQNSRLVVEELFSLAGKIFPCPDSAPTELNTTTGRYQLSMRNNSQPSKR